MKLFKKFFKKKECSHPFNRFIVDGIELVPHLHPDEYRYHTVVRGHCYLCGKKLYITGDSV